MEVASPFTLPDRNGPEMDEEPYIIAALMAEEERRRREKDGLEEKGNKYQQFPYEQSSTLSRLG